VRRSRQQRGRRSSTEEGTILRSLYVRAILVVLVLAALAALLGDDNIVWGS